MSDLMMSDFFYSEFLFSLLALLALCGKKFEEGVSEIKIKHSKLTSFYLLALCDKIDFSLLALLALLALCDKIGFAYKVS